MSWVRVPCSTMWPSLRMTVELAFTTVDRQTIGDDEGRFAHAITARWPIGGALWKPGRKSTAADSHLTSFFSRRSSGTITDEGAMMEMPCAGANNLAM